MEIGAISSCTRGYTFRTSSRNAIPCWLRNPQKSRDFRFEAKIDHCKWRSAEMVHLNGRSVLVVAAEVIKKKKNRERLTEVSSEKKGSIIGAVALIIGSSVGSGILALPKKTSAAGFLPTAVTMVVCWGFLLLEALLLVEMNVKLARKKKQLEFISIRTMAEEALGKSGGTVATVIYVFLAYTSLVIYASKSGDILSHLISLPSWISSILFTCLFAILVSAGSNNLTDNVNRWLTASMIGLLIAIETIAIFYGGWSGFAGTGNWQRVPETVSVIIFTLVYHDLVPVLCAYLGGDHTRIKTSVILGSLLPLLIFLAWDAVALGLSPPMAGIDPVDLLMGVKWSGVPVMVEAFSLLAIGTSIIGTLLSFFKFFLEQLNNLSDLNSSSTQMVQEKYEKALASTIEENGSGGVGKWWGSNRLALASILMAVAPPLLISTTIPDAFSVATDVAGGYCMSILYGVLPPIMAWTMHSKLDGGGGGNEELIGMKPTLIGVGLFGCGIVVEQILQDILLLHL